MLMRTPENLSGEYTAISAHMDAVWNNNNSAWAQIQAQALRAVRAEAGDPTLMSSFNVNGNANPANFYFNRIRPICNMTSGYQRKNRKSSVVVPLENGDQATADQWTKIVMQVFKKENVYEAISQAFHQGACVTGLNFIQMYLDFANDPLNGDIKFDVLDLNEVFFDPFARKPDFSDAQFIWRRSFLTPASAAAICPPEMYRDIMSMQGSPSGMSKDARFQFMPEAYGTTQSNKLTYDEYYYRDYRKAKFMYDNNTGDIRDVTFEDGNAIDLMLYENEQLSYYEREVPTVNLALRVQGNVIYNGRQPLGIDSMPFIPVVGYYSKSLPFMYQRIAGMVASLIDPQILFNRRVNLNGDLAESLMTSGFKFQEGSVVDVKHLFQTGAGRVIPIKEGYSMEAVQQLQPPQVPPSFFQLQDVFDKELYNVVGLSEENLGKISGGDVSGYLAAQRTAAGLTALQPIFDRLDLSQNMLVDLMMEVIRVNYTPGKIRRMLEGEEPAELFYSRAFGKYHSQTQLGFNTETQQQLQFAQLLMLRKDAGVAITDKDMIEAATLQHKDKMISNMEAQAQQQAQMQQQQAEQQMKLQQAQAELAQARSLADLGLYNERTSRVQENFALAEERRAEAVQNENKALLDFVRAAKELEGLDLAHIKELIQMQQLIKAQEAENHLAERSTSKEPTPEENLKQQQQEQQQMLQQQTQQQPGMEQMMGQEMQNPGQEPQGPMPL